VAGGNKKESDMTSVRINPRRASAGSVSTWLQLAKNYRDQARRESEAAPAYARQLVLLARRCEHQASRLADFQATTAEVLEGILADIKALAEGNA